MKRKFYFTEHALIEIDNDGLEIEEVMEVATTGTEIENYPDDKPIPSCLKLGWKENLPVHVVLSVSDDERIHIITAYRPDKNKWSNDYKIRIK